MIVFALNNTNKLKLPRDKTKLTTMDGLEELRAGEDERRTRERSQHGLRLFPSDHSCTQTDHRTSMDLVHNEQKTQKLEIPRKTNRHHHPHCPGGEECWWRRQTHTTPHHRHQECACLVTSSTVRAMCLVIPLTLTIIRSHRFLTTSITSAHRHLLALGCNAF